MTTKRNKPAKKYELTAIGGDRYHSLEAALAAAKGPVVEALVVAIMEGLASGALVVVDGSEVFTKPVDAWFAGRANPAIALCPLSAGLHCTFEIGQVFSHDVLTSILLCDILRI